MTTISAFPRATDAVKHASAMTAPVDQTAAAQPATGRIVGRGRRLATRALGRLRSDQGDVPGWVLITLMTGVERGVRVSAGHAMVA